MSAVRAVLGAAAERLVAAGIDSARLDARVLLAHVLGIRAGEIPVLSRDLTRDEQIAFDALLARRGAREPLAYITGVKEFWSLDFEVGPGALIPRPETETLIESALKAFPERDVPLSMLDLGTGTGCLLLTALTLYPSAAGIGIDAAPAALAWAGRNVKRHGLRDRATLRQGDWSAAAGNRFDIVFSNPPYLARAEMTRLEPELAYEPASALESGPDGLDAYRALGPAIASALAPGGRAFIEIGAGQGPGASAALEQGGLEILSIAPDLSAIPRCIVARLPG